jgi:CheY-like chemotaxis protein
MLKIKILIVEDEIITANDLKQRLENMDHSVVGIVGNGEDAIKKAGETSPDIILMDIVLKGNMDGIETAQQIINIYNIPIIYLTSYYDDEILEKSSETKPYGYITKPYEDLGLNTVIKMAVYKHQNRVKIENNSIISKIIDKIIKT